MNVDDASYSTPKMMDSSVLLLFWIAFVDCATLIDYKMALLTGTR